MLTDYLFYHSKELKKIMLKKIIEILSHIMYLKLKKKDFNVLIDGKCFFNLPVRNEAEGYEKVIEMNNNNDYTTGNLLDFTYYKENCRLIAIDLSKQTKLKDPQQINFIGKIEGHNNGLTMFFLI